MTELMGYPLTYTLHSGVDQQPLGMGSPAVAPYGAYRTADGQTAVLGTTNDREWQRLARDILGRDDLADDDRFRTNSGRVAHREVLDEAVGQWCARHDLEHVQKTADAAGIGNARYNLPSEVLLAPSWPPGIAGVESTHPSGRYLPYCRPRSSPATRPRWARFPVWGSTPTRCSPSSAWAMMTLPNCAARA